MTNLPPYDIRTWIYPNSGVNPIDPASWGLETDVSTFVRYPGNDGGQAITYTNGRQDEASNVDAGTMSLTFDNRDGRFCTKNMAGPYFGRLDRNTPIRVGMTALVDTFTRSTSLGTVGVSDSGHNWTTTSANLQANGTQLVANGMPTNNVMTAVSLDGGGQDMDIQVDIIPPAFTITGASLCSGIVARYQDNSNLWGARTEFNTAGDVTIKIFKFVGGSYSEPAAINPIPSTTYSQGVAWRLRVQVIGATIYAKTWPKASAEPAAWMIQATEPALMNGRQIGVNILRANLNTNSTGNTMVFDNFTSTAFEWTGTVSQWPTTWDMSGNNAWAPIQANGILRRLQQGKGLLQSPLRRQLSDLNKNPSAYWPMEDGAGASQLASALSQADRNFPAIISGGVTVAGDTGPAGGGTAVVISDVTGQVRGNTLVKTLPAGIKGFSAMIFTKFSSPLGSKQAVCQWNGTGTGVKWVFSMDAGNTYIDVYDNNGQNISTASNTLPAAPFDVTKWVAWQLETDVSGSNTAWSFLEYQVGTVAFFAMTGSFAYTGNSVVKSFIVNPNKTMSGVSIGHAWLGPNTLPFVTSSFAAVSSGYAGELAAARATRIAGEEGIPILVEPGTSVAMGPQPPATALQVLQQCQDADQGILYEVGAGLGFRPGGNRYSPSVNLALVVANGHLSAAPQAIDDDQRVLNSITVNRTGGSSAVVTNDVSIAAIGLYDSSLSVNLNSDHDLAQLAAWKVFLGTYGALRWPQISLNLARIAGLPPIWRGKRYGMRTTIKTGMPQVTGNDPDVIVEGYQATLWPHGWTANLNCSSAAPYAIPLTGDNGLRVDADTSTVSTAFSNANTMDLSTNQENFPTDVSGYTPSAGGTLTWAAGGNLDGGSAQLTASASPPSQVYFRNNTPVVVTTGNTYIITGWVFGGAVSNVSLSVDWATSGAVYISTSSVNVTLPINTWTQFWGVVTAPATAARATYGPTMATPTASQTIFVDNLKFLDGAATQLTVDNGGQASSTWVPTSTLPAEVPFNIIIDGEVMTVHSCGNIFSTTKQILSVERSINTVNKSHAVGALVRLQTPSYLAL